MPPALQFLVLTFAGWVNRHQDDLNDRAQNPALRAARGHAEIQAAAVGHPASACPRSSRLHRAGGESLVRMALGEVPHIYPHYNPDCVGSEECVWDD